MSFQGETQELAVINSALYVSERELHRSFTGLSFSGCVGFLFTGCLRARAHAGTCETGQWEKFIISESRLLLRESHL